MDASGLVDASVVPYLTADLPGAGGVVKAQPEDFIVEEIPLYAPAGDGTHLYLHIEKRGITTIEAARRIARAAGKLPRDVGYAGLKDSAAVARQTLSIEHVDPGVLESADLGRLTVLRIDRHTNKLKPGHLKGNRFVIKVRGVVASSVAHARRVVDELSRRGLPNYFGPQRFGARGDNWLIGRYVLMGDCAGALSVYLGRPGPRDSGDILIARRHFDAGHLERAAACWPHNCADQRRVCRAMIRAGGDARMAWRAVDRPLRRLFLSAFQSHLFNRVVADRIEGLDRLEVGDLAWKHQNGACFPVLDATQEQARCDAFDISPTGPIFGRRMTEATGRPGEREARILADAGIERSAWTARDGIRLDGARRPLRVPLGNPGVDCGSDMHGDYLRLSFALPPGSYATCVTREVCKNDVRCRG